MKILLLGANGQLGRELHDILKATRHTIHAFMRADLDLERPISDRALDDIDFDVLVNTAAIHRVDDIERDPHAAFLVNSIAVEQLAKNCVRKNAHFIHVSTDYVFGEIRNVDWRGRDTPYLENVPIAPLNDYGRSKALGESHALNAWLEGTTIIRVAALFGRFGSSGKGGNFVESMLRATAGEQVVSVVDDQIMSPTHAYDAALAILHLMNHRITGTFHVVNGGHTSWFGLAAHALHQDALARGTISTGAEQRLRPCKTSERPATAARRPAWSALDNGKLETYGFRMPHWTDAVGQYLRFRPPAV